MDKPTYNGKAVMWIPLTRLYAWRPKHEETAHDEELGMVSRTLGPIEVVRVSRGKYLIMNGHHRVAECKAREIQAVENVDWRYAEVVNRMISDSVRIGGKHDKTPGRTTNGS